MRKMISQYGAAKSGESSSLLAQSELVKRCSSISTMDDSSASSKLLSMRTSVDQQTEHEPHHHHHGRSQRMLEHQGRQAVFVTALVSTCMVSLFALGPRLAFAGSPFTEPTVGVLFAVQQVASVVFVVLYLVGARYLRQVRARKLRSYKLLRGDTSLTTVHQRETRWKPLSLDHPANFVIQFCVAGVLPMVLDVFSLCGGRWGDRLRWAGTLRLLHLALYQPAFRVLDMNLCVPEAAAPVIRTSLILIFFTHYAACILWLLARWDGYSEKTWVGDQAPWLADWSVASQYAWSLYFSVITVSTVGYGDYHAVNTAEAATIALYVLSSIWLVANIVGVLSALAALADTDMAEQRAKIARFERMLDSEHITPDVATAALEYLRSGLGSSSLDVDALPASVRLRIRRQRFGQLLYRMPLLDKVSDRLLKQCVSLVKEDSFVKGLDVVRAGDLESRLYVIVDGHASVHVDPRKGLWASVKPQQQDKDAGATGNEGDDPYDDEDDGDDSSSSSDSDEDEATAVEAAAILHPGAYFGAPGFVSLVPQPYTIRARTLLRVVSLDENDRRELERNNPNDWSRLRRNLMDGAKDLAAHADSLAAQIDAGTAPTHRVRLPKHRVALEKPPSLPSSRARAYADEQRAVVIAVERDVSAASHALSAHHCHVASRGDVAELRRLIDLVDLKQVEADYDGRTACHLAAANGHAACVDLLVQKGAKVNAKDRFGRTPLHEAVLHGHDACLARLVAAGGRLELPAPELASYLCQAVMASDSPLLIRYLDAGADVDVADYDRRTALHLAASEGNIQICRHLLTRGANARLEDRWGHTASDEAQHFGHTGAIYLLLKAAQQGQATDQWTSRATSPATPSAAGPAPAP